jgi:hypothetical protein
LTEWIKYVINIEIRRVPLKTTFGILFIVAAGSALADQATTLIGSGFANACAGDQYFGSLPNPGDGFSTLTDQYMTCQTTAGVSASATASNSGTVGSYSYSNSATADAGPGFIKVGASNSGVQAIPFPGGAAYGGWNDTMTITGGSGSAVWVVPITVKGTLDASGAGALTRLGINAYENYGFLQPYGTLNAFAYGVFLADNGGASGIRNNAIAFGWDYQGAWFGADNYSPPDSSMVPSYSLNRTLYFAFPFTYGTPFEFGIYMGGVAGEGSSGGGYTANSASYDFTHTVTWGGAGEVIDQSSQVNPNFTLTSGSGFNYSQAYAPEPATGCGLLMGLGVLGWLKRRHS